ncbi:Peptidoglycan D,D-transpeptidase MrdA [hydrothermal vent metagenome]|uniref:Peptidoglycan D,D-transpeptidase MrdA n=1 Tax=hydrothermal vent metagenome TaxID=652676 RepID=A0A3B0TCF5_9ZZZZ
MIFDREEYEDREAFTRRALLLGVGQAALFGVVGARLYGLQIIDGKRYRLLAEDNRINLSPLAPVRGNLRDRFGAVVASAEHRLKVSVTPNQAGDLAQTLTRLARIVPIDGKLRKTILARARSRGYLPIEIVGDLDWETFAKLNLYALHLPGVRTEVGWVRTYPLAAAFGHVTGYVGVASRRDSNGDAVLRLPGFRIGKTGIEKTFDADLRGTAGTVYREVNASGRTVREIRRDRPRAGRELVLTIDAGLQAMALERLGEETGAAVVMDIQNGDVLAMASTPSFDPGLFADGIGSKAWRGLIGDKGQPLTNRSIAGQYPPGSTFKIVTASAAIDLADVDPKKTVYCPGWLRYGGQRFRCWKHSGHGRVNMRSAIKVSCDVYFYTVALEMGIDNLADMGRRFGFGEAFAFAGAKAGVMPTKGWKRSALGEPWYGGETVIAGIGQGYVLSTPLQLAVMTARTANGNWAVRPRFVRPPPGEAPPKFAPLDVSPAALAVVRAGLDAVVNERGGTAGRSKLKLEGVAMAGKTGTSQVRSSRGDNRKDMDKPRKERPHALFVAYAPVNTPRYAAAVVIEHGASGSRAAAPVVRDILTEALTRDILGQPVFGEGGPEQKHDREPENTVASAKPKGKA